ncbi:MAG: thioesterase family protein [Kiritimatiellae bacterium]|nr:thioesterase family protein [Kiritimatiellia bacterium]
MNALLQHEVELEVAFHHLDPMDVVWHGNYFRYFERARCALMRLIDYDFPQMKASGFTWPVIDCQCRYSSPILYDMKIRVLAELVEYENRLKIRYTIRDAADGRKLCAGSTTQAAVDMRTEELCFVTPDTFQDRLRPHLKRTDSPT